MLLGEREGGGDPDARVPVHWNSSLRGSDEVDCGLRRHFQKEAMILVKKKPIDFSFKSIIKSLVMKVLNT